MSAATLLSAFSTARVEWLPRPPASRPTRSGAHDGRAVGSSDRRRSSACLSRSSPLARASWLALRRSHVTPHAMTRRSSLRFCCSVPVPLVCNAVWMVRYCVSPWRAHSAFVQTVAAQMPTRPGLSSPVALASRRARRSDQFTARRPSTLAGAEAPHLCRAIIKARSDIVRSARRRNSRIGPASPAACGPTSPSAQETKSIPLPSSRGFDEADLADDEVRMAAPHDQPVLQIGDKAVLIRWDRLRKVDQGVPHKLVAAGAGAELLRPALQGPTVATCRLRGRRMNITPSEDVLGTKRSICRGKWPDPFRSSCGRSTPRDQPRLVAWFILRLLGQMHGMRSGGCCVQERAPVKCE